MRIFTLFVCFLIMLGLGGIYAWSIYVPHLKGMYHYEGWMTQLIFGCTILTFSFTMFVAGYWVRTKGPFQVTFMGGIFLGVAYLLASRVLDFPFLTLACIGILGGIGIGCSYMSSLTVAQSLFPNHKGLSTGIVVGGFGSGAMVFSLVLKNLFASGWILSEVFILIGIALASVILLGSFCFRNNTPLSTQKETFVWNLGFDNPYQKTLAWMLFCGSLAGLMMIGNAKPMTLEKGFTEDIGTLSVTFLAFGNMLGRFFWGWIIDRISFFKAILACLGISILSGILFGMSHDPYSLYIALAGVGLGFSGNMVLYAAHIGQKYGSDQVSVIYPKLFLYYGWAGLFGPLLGGWIQGLTGSFTGSLIFALGILAIGLGLLAKKITTINSNLSK